jgi:hypothetical protein
MTVTERIMMLGYFAVALVLSLKAPKVWRWFVSRSTESWTEAEGVVVTTNVIDQQAEGALAEIGYSYCVAGARYGGYLRRHFICLEHAWNFADRAKDMHILVHYKPDRPEKSVIWQSLN